MQLQVRKRVTINEPANKVWQILAHEFAHIDKWCSGIKHSCATSTDSTPDGAPVSGRICDSSHELLTHYDEQSMRFSYMGVGLPSFIKKLDNTWSVTAID